MTRKNIRTALDRILGISTSETVMMGVRSSILRLRTPIALKSESSRDLVEIITGRSFTETVLRRLRTASAKATRLR